MKNIIWLASYPKSGNTWIRILLANYLQDSDKPVDINKLYGGAIASSRIWFDEWAGIEASALSDNIIMNLRPHVYRCMANNMPDAKDVIHMKVHDAWAINEQGEAIFPEDATLGVVYIIRNPLDMAASCANHWGVSIDKAIDNMCNTEFSLARSFGGLIDQLHQILGSWTTHIQSWIDKSGLPVCIIRYEDLRQDTISVFAKIINFCKLPFDKDKLIKAVEFSDFSELQKQEKAYGFKERSVKSSDIFFRKGKLDAWREELTDSQARLLIKTHESTMRRFGYFK